MATIAKLAAKISADGSSFEKTADRTKKKAEELGGVAQKISGAFVNLKSIALASAAFIAAKLSSDTLKGAVDNLHTARDIGDDVSSIQALEQALRDVGQPAEKAGELLRDLTKTLATGVSGDSATVDTFKRLGLSVADLQKMRPSEAFAVISDAFQKIDDPSRRAALGVQIFKDNVRVALPLLSQGSSALKDGADRAKLFGNNLSNIEANKIETAKITMDNFLAVLKGVGLQIANVIIPVVLGLINAMKAVGTNGQTVSSVIKVAFDYILSFFAVLREVFRVVQIALSFVGIGFLTVIDAILSGLQSVADAGAKLPDRLGGKAFREMASDIRGARSAVQEWREGLFKGVDDDIKNLGSSFSLVGSFIAGMDTGAAAFASTIERVRNAGGALNKAFAFGNLFKEGNDLFNQTKTPLTKFSDQMVKYNALLKSGAISWETYARSTGSAVEELEKAHNLQSIALPGGLKANSSEAISAINQDQQRQDQRYQVDPIKRVENILKASQKIESGQLKNLEKISEAVANQKVVKF